jgi:hypothetical protein
MKQYFAEMQSLNNPKNKAEDAVQNYAKGVNHTLIHGDENLQLFVEQFKIKVEEINRNFARCRVSELQWIQQHMGVGLRRCQD